MSELLQRMSIKRFLLGNDCDGDSGRCLADMVGDEEGDYVLYDDHAAEVKRLRAENDAVKIAAWDKSSEQLREMARLRLERDALRAEVERLREYIRERELIHARSLDAARGES